MAKRKLSPSRFHFLLVLASDLLVSTILHGRLLVGGGVLAEKLEI